MGVQNEIFRHPYLPSPMTKGKGKINHGKTSLHKMFSRTGKKNRVSD